MGKEFHPRSDNAVLGIYYVGICQLEAVSTCVINRFLMTTAPCDHQGCKLAKILWNSEDLMGVTVYF